MPHKRSIQILKIVIPILSLTLGALYIWFTQTSKNKAQMLPSSKNLRIVSSSQEQYFLQELDMNEEQDMTEARQLLMPSSKSGFVIPTFVHPEDITHPKQTHDTSDESTPVEVPPSASNTVTKEAE